MFVAHSSYPIEIPRKSKDDNGRCSCSVNKGILFSLSMDSKSGATAKTLSQKTPSNLLRMSYMILIALFDIPISYMSGKHMAHLRSPSFGLFLPYMYSLPMYLDGFSTSRKPGPRQPSRSTIRPSSSLSIISQILSHKESINYLPSFSKRDTSSGFNLYA